MNIVNSSIGSFVKRVTCFNCKSVFEFSNGDVLKYIRRDKRLSAKPSGFLGLGPWIETRQFTLYADVTCPVCRFQELHEVMPLAKEREESFSYDD